MCQVILPASNDNLLDSSNPKVMCEYYTNFTEKKKNKLNHFPAAFKISDLLLLLEEKLSAFHLQVWCSLRACFMQVLLCEGAFYLSVIG